MSRVRDKRGVCGNSSTVGVDQWDGVVEGNIDGIIYNFFLLPRSVHKRITEGDNFHLHSCFLKMIFVSNFLNLNTIFCSYIYLQTPLFLFKGLLCGANKYIYTIYMTAIAIQCRHQPAGGARSAGVSPWRCGANGGASSGWRCGQERPQ